MSLYMRQPGIPDAGWVGRYKDSLPTWMNFPAPWLTPRKPPKTLQGLPYDIQVLIWKDVVDSLEPQILSLDVDGLRDISPKPFRDGTSDTYKYLSLEGKSGDEVDLAETKDTDRLVSRQRLRISTWRVRFFASLCKNSREAIIREYPHVLGLAFSHSLNRRKNLGPKDGVIRFNGDTDLLVLSVAQWERQIHFLRNKTWMMDVFRIVRNLGLDVETMWNDRLLQNLDSSFVTKPGGILRSTGPRGLNHRGQSSTPSRPMPGLIDNPRFGDWILACGCDDRRGRETDADWNPDRSLDPDAWAVGHLPRCIDVCRREPLPVFVKALPNLQTLVLTLMDNPIRRPRNYSREKKQVFSSLHKGKHALTTDNEDTYFLIAYPVHESVVNEASMWPFWRIKSQWRRRFPYTQEMNNLKVKIMRPTTGAPCPWNHANCRFLSHDVDVPYIYALHNDPMFPEPSRKRPADDSGSEGDRKRQKTDHKANPQGKPGTKRRKRKGYAGWTKKRGKKTKVIY